MKPDSANCYKRGVIRFGEGCRFNNDCQYPTCSLMNTERIQHLRLALATNDIFTDDKTADIILRTVDALNKLHGELTIKDIINIRGEVEFAHAQYKLQSKDALV